MLFFIGKLFDQFVGRTLTSVTHAAETKIHNQTVGRVQGKIGTAQGTVKQKALRTVDRALDRVFSPGKGQR